jgi:hypothetical protein
VATDRSSLSTLDDRFVDAARRDPERLFELGAELARAHAVRLGIEGVAPKSVELLACPGCGGRVLALLGPSEGAACAAGCGWRGTVAEACR